jgi:glycosyltransferase involved in cell wall biosynthesis
VKRKKITFLHITPFPKYSGGADNWLFNIINKFEEHDVDIRIFTPKSKKDNFFDIKKFKKLSILELPIISIEETIFKIFSNGIFKKTAVLLHLLIWTIRASVVITRNLEKNSEIVVLNTIPALLPLVFANSFGKKLKIICYLRGVIGDDLSSQNMFFLSKIYIFLERITLKKCTKILSNGYDTSLYIENHFNLASTVIPNGVNLLHKKNNIENINEKNLQRVLEYRSTHKIILLLGTLRDIKGVNYFIEAANYIKKYESNEKYKFVLAGKGDTKKYVDYANKLNVADDCFFIGEIKNVEALLGFTDIGVAISGGGGMSHSALEMMGSGIPVVAWNNLTYSQIFEHNFSALLAKDKDSNSLALNILKLIKNEDLSMKLSLNCRSQALYYEWDNVLNIFIQSLEE